MGRKLNLSHLSDDECRQVLAVIQRDFNVRQAEKDRILKIQGFVENEAQKRLVLSRQMEFNKKHCMCCFSTFGLIFNKKVKCEKCNFFICKDCMSKTEADSKAVICLPCNQQRELQERACQWFYDQMKAKFRRFGSAKVVRSLYKRQSESGTSESEHNSDSGVDHPFSPLLKKGGAFKRDGSADTIDEETNTEVEESSAPAEVYSALLLRNPDWLKQFKPESESVGVQAPDDNLANGGKDYWGLVGEDSTDGAAERLKKEDSDGTDSDLYARRCHSRLHPKVVTPADNQPTKSKSSKASQPNAKRDNVTASSSTSQNTLQPPDKNRDSSSVCMLSPIQEVSSPESSEAQDNESNASKKKEAEKSVFNFNQDDEDGKRDGEALIEQRAEPRQEAAPENEEETISPGEADSGIHMSFPVTSEERQEQGNQDTPLRHPIRVLDEMSESMEAFAASALRDTIQDEQPNSLETNVCSPRKNMSDVTKAKAVFTQKYEASDRNGNLVEIEPVELSCSSDEDGFDEDIDQEENCAMNFEEFMKQIQGTGSSKSKEASPQRKGPKSKKSKDKSKDGKEEKKIPQSKDDASSSPKRKALSKRSHSAGDFRAQHQDDAEKKEKRPVKLSRSASNRFIRYDSLPLVVEVYEADASSPSPSFKDSPSKLRFVYDSGPESESTPEQNGKGLLLVSSSTSGSSEAESQSKSRQASVESGTTEGTFPNSTSISSLSSMTDGDRRKSADSVALKSSFDSDIDLINSPNHSFVRLGGGMETPLKSESGMAERQTEDLQEGQDFSHGAFLFGERRQLSLVKQSQVSEEPEVNSEVKTQPNEDDEKKRVTSKDQEGKPPKEEAEGWEETSEVPVAPSSSPKSSPATPRKSKESIEIANLTKKFCMKQEEVLRSAEEVLSSASQLSEIQSHIDKLEKVLNSLERKVVGETSSISSVDSVEIITPPPSPNAAKSLVSEDIESLHRDLDQFPSEVISPSEVNMASAVRMITATALKVLSTTEDVMDAHLDEDGESTPGTEDRNQACCSQTRPSATAASETALEGQFSHNFAEHALLGKRGDPEGSSSSRKNSQSSMDVEEPSQEQGPTEVASPQSQTSLSPGSTGSMIFRVTSGKDSPPTATLFFSCDEPLASQSHDYSPSQDDYADEVKVQGDTYSELVDPDCEEMTVMVLEDDTLFTDDGVESRGGSELESNVEVSVFDHHFGNKNGIVDPLTLLYNQVTELEEKVYLSAGKVYTLEERLLQLEQEVETIDDNTAEEILAALEDKLALTVAQVSQNEVEVSSVEDEIAGLESSSAGKIMSSVYSLDNTTPFKVSTATYFLNQPDVDLFQSGMLEVKFPSDDLIAAMKASNLQDISSLDARWGTVVVHRISHGGETDGGKTEFHWSNETFFDWLSASACELIEQRFPGGGNSETDENENAVGITDIDGLSSDSDASNEHLTFLPQYVSGNIEATPDATFDSTIHS
ncbi:Rab effector MyRIP [Holothuria leucospilota]|uniref:Rab effector MyRIP n=1 Tax=Holothuria leucospilota TaxID=206669 RepID=A0A9Q1BBY8_HOLLE|nr:Rab effector MyRIP [Holothuria leucospilota]